jgi:hypothetical protein
MRCNDLEMSVQAVQRLWSKPMKRGLHSNESMYERDKTMKGVCVIQKRIRFERMPIWEEIIQGKNKRENKKKCS